MTLGTLLLRNLAHHWRGLLAVGTGVAVGATVLTGSLIVGDSMRASLRDLTLDRLGSVDCALVGSRFFREQLAAEVGNRESVRAASAILLRSSAVHGGTNARAGHVNVLGVDERFWELASQPAEIRNPQSAIRNLKGDQVVLNEILARDLAARVGDDVLVRFENSSVVPRDSVMGRRADVVAAMRLTVAAVIPARGPGRFSLQADQQLPRNAYVTLATLQRALKIAGRANAILVSGQRDAEPLQQLLKRSLTLDDLDLHMRLNPARGYVALESRRMILDPAIVTAALAVAKDLDLSAAPTLTYLANTIAIGRREIPYSTVIACDDLTRNPTPRAFGAESKIQGLKDDEILLNDWAAADLNAKAGDVVRLDYYVVGARGELLTTNHTFTLAGIVPLAGATGDPMLTPDYPGIVDARTMADWNPPFPVDLKRVRPKDEAYWDAHHGTPKAFVSLATGQRLWSSRFGNLTAVRLVPRGAGAPPAQSDLSQTAVRFSKELLNRLQPDQLGLVFQPVKEQGLRAAAGATDFGQLFLGFSIFLVFSAVMLVALLFRLAIEQRAREIGILLATGFSTRIVRRLLLLEGGGTAVIGCALGLLGAVGYGGLMLAGLCTWWLPAVGTPFLKLDVTINALAIGGFGGLLVALVSIWWTLRSLRKQAPVALMAGKHDDADGLTGDGRGARWRWRAGGAAALIAVGSLVASAFGGATEAATGFLLGGVSLLAAALLFISGWFRRGHSAPAAHRRRVVWLGVRNGKRHPGRSVLTAGLVASATFLVMAVTAFHQTPGSRPPEKSSGDGGFALVAEADVPLNISQVATASLAGAHAIPFRLRPGDDTSCLNLYAPEKPRILGATDAMIERGGFRFSATLATTPAERANPWLLLRRDFGAGVVPVFGDANSVEWILHSGLGQDFTITDERGQPVRLRFVGLLSGSVFQSELIMSEAHFLKLFPSQSGYGFFLIETPVERARAVARTLEESLGEYGLRVTPTAERLASFAVVENTYLATFQTLGGLGLVLGTLGLGAILLRNVLERRGELALLRALGFSQRSLAVLVLAENGFLLALGLICGVTCALLAVAPHLKAHAVEMPWMELVLMMALVIVAGMSSSALAVRAALRVPMLSALCEE